MGKTWKAAFALAAVCFVGTFANAQLNVGGTARGAGQLGGGALNTNGSLSGSTMGSVHGDIDDTMGHTARHTMSSDEHATRRSGNKPRSAQAQTDAKHNDAAASGDHSKEAEKHISSLNNQAQGNSASDTQTGVSMNHAGKGDHEISEMKPNGTASSTNVGSADVSRNGASTNTSSTSSGSLVNNSNSGTATGSAENSTEAQKSSVSSSTDVKAAGTASAEAPRRK